MPAQEQKKQKSARGPENQPSKEFARLFNKLLILPEALRDPA